MQIPKKYKITYPHEIELDVRILEKIRKYMKKHYRGRTINNVMEDTGYARGTVKTYLTAMRCKGELREENYNQNTKVFFIKEVRTTCQVRRRKDNEMG